MRDEERHIAEEVLIDYADDPASVRDRALLESHLAVCAACWSKLDDYRLLARAMSDEETWWTAGQLESGDGEQALRDFVERCAAEDVDAERLLRDVRESQYRFAYAKIARRRQFQTGGVVRRLCQAAWEECPHPRFARDLAEAACAIADALPDDHYPAAAVNELRGRAWKEYSTACRYLAQFAAGFDALSRAERAYKRLPDPESQVAAVDLCRALLLWEQQRYDEALPYARSAARVFSERRETRHYFNAREVEALILHRQGSVSAACETYLQLFTYADDIDDAELKARSARNLGVAYRDKADVGSASEYLLIALRLFEELDQHAMVVETTGLIARLTLTAGNPTEAANKLPALIDEMRRLGKTADAARAQLDLAEALLILERFEEVEAVCAGLAAYFRKAEMLTGALTAAAYLKEAAARRSLTKAHIDQVREYLAALDRTPNLPFTSPLE